jgi:hypothetical protein
MLRYYSGACIKKGPLLMKRPRFPENSVRVNWRDLEVDRESHTNRAWYLETRWQIEHGRWSACSLICVFLPFRVGVGIKHIEKVNTEYRSDSI